VNCTLFACSLYPQWTSPFAAKGVTGAVQEIHITTVVGEQRNVTVCQKLHWSLVDETGANDSQSTDYSRIVTYPSYTPGPGGQTTPALGLCVLCSTCNHHRHHHIIHGDTKKTGQLASVTQKMTLLFHIVL